MTPRAIPLATALAVLLLCAAAYLGALPNGFVSDDWDLVAHNSWLEQGPILDAFRPGCQESMRGGSFYYHPVVSISFWIDHLIWGVKPFGYHLTNLILHAAASLLVLALAARWLRTLDAGLAAAAVFAVHPIHTQSVTWIAGRIDLLAALFFLLALYCQQRAVEISAGGAAPARPASRRRPRMSAHALLHQGVSILALALALLSKEIAVIYPAALILHALLVHRSTLRPKDVTPDSPATPADEDPAPSRRWWVPVAASAGVVAVYVLIRLAVVGHVAGYAGDPHAWWKTDDGTFSRLLAVPLILAFYLRRLLFPWWLGFESGIEPVRDLDEIGVWISLGGLVALGYLAFRFRRREPAVPFGTAWFLLTILPVANIFPISESAMEHFAYLPSAGLIVVAVAVGRYLLRAPAVRFVACALLVALLGARTIARNTDWKDEERFWRVTARDTPSARAFNNLGLHLKAEGRLREAREALARVAALEPGFPSSWANLGAVAEAEGNRKEAIHHFRRALAIDPTDAAALHDLALTLEKNERGERYGPGFPAEEAVATYQRLLDAHPDHAEGWTDLGALYEVLKRFEEAAPCYERAIGAAPDLPEPHALLGSILWSRGERARAADLYRRYLALAPNGEHAAEARSRSSP